MARSTKKKLSGRHAVEEATNHVWALGTQKISQSSRFIGEQEVTNTSRTVSSFTVFPLMAGNDYIW